MIIVKSIILFSGLLDFKTISATPALRNKFINELMNIVRNYQLDGVDIDWEYTSTADGTDVTFCGADENAK